MAETWGGRPTLSGYYNSDTGQIGSSTTTVTDLFHGYYVWADAPFGDAESILSAYLALTPSGNGAYVVADFFRGNSPTSGTLNPDGPAVRAVRLNRSSTTSVTAALKDVASSGWAEGYNLGLRLKQDAVGTHYSWTATLTVTWEEQTQELSPRVVTGTFRFGGPVSVEYSVQPAPVTVVGHVGVPDVLAPRTLSVEPITVTSSVAGTITKGTGQGPVVTQAETLNIVGTVSVALLSVTVAPLPPPVPWRRLIVSPEYAEALASREPVTDARVEVIDKDDAVIATLGGTDATHPGVVAGSVTCTGDGPIRWTCDLTINNPDLLPTAVGDLLHPLSHNRVRIWWMTQLKDKSWGEVPVGTYYLDWPSVTDDGEAAVGMSAQGSDAVAELKRNTWNTLLDVADLEASEAVRRILQDRAPWAKTAITPSDHRLPAEWEAGEPGGDPVDDITAIADAAGMVFYADRMGVLTLDDRPTLLSATVARFMEGPDAAITSISADIDLDEVLNRVTVSSTGRLEDSSGEELPPIVAVAEDDDSTSPLWVGYGHIYHRRVESDQIATQAEADRLAADILDDARALVDQVELVVFAHPHLEPGDVVEVSAVRAGVAGHRQVDDWALALGDLSGQRITSSGRRGLT